MVTQASTLIKWEERKIILPFDPTIPRVGRLKAWSTSGITQVGIKHCCLVIGRLLGGYDRAGKLVACINLRTFNDALLRIFCTNLRNYLNAPCLIFCNT